MIRAVAPQQVTWILEHSVVVAASKAFVWAWRSDISTWHDPPAQFELDGLFVSGARGRTFMPGQAPLAWTLTEVREGESFVAEIALEDATALFEWRFDAIDDRHTRMTQRIGVSGSNAQAFVEQVRAGFGGTLAEGMARLADSIENAARERDARPD